MESVFFKDKNGRDMVEALTSTTSTGGTIYVIKLIHEIGPQELAMMQAMYSRSYAPILKHLKEVSEKGADKFMQQFFVNYGHKSIADCGSVLICVENVSMLAVKAIQDSQLYAGQEASTRYIDFSTQPFMSYDINGKLTTASDGSETSVLQDRLREFYLDALPRVNAYLRDKIPYESIDQTKCTIEVYERTIKARSFDIVRAFLPAGAVTSAAWYTSISHAADHLGWLRNHLLDEVKEIANTIQLLLSDAYPASFNNRKISETKEKYKADYYNNHYYLEGSIETGNIDMFIDEHMLLSYKDELLSRPERQDLPAQIGECGVIRYTDFLDFASFRDVQRHRAVVQRMGLLTFEAGFHDWYIDNLPYDLRLEAIEFMRQHEAEINKLEGLSVYEKQYLIPMGYRVPISLTGTLSKMLYIVELRAQKVVHPTLHANAYHLGMMIKKYLDEKLYSDVPVYMDDEVGMFSLESSKAVKHRGSQTILKYGKEL